MGSGAVEETEVPWNPKTSPPPPRLYVNISPSQPTLIATYTFTTCIPTIVFLRWNLCAQHLSISKVQYS